MQPFTLLVKPAGSDCNLDCRYCFYKHRSPQIGSGRQRMSDTILEQMTKDYLQLQFPVCGFAWQGGEPTLMGLDFYKRAVELQKKYAAEDRQIGNALQTNAILLDDNWCDFLHKNNFLVGISIDGPKEFHDYYRKDHAGGGSLDKVMAALNRCKAHKVEFNVLVLLNSVNVDHPDELIDFFIENGVKYLQFIPCVETEPATGKIAEFSITPAQYGQFLCRTFDRWLKAGPENLSIRDFESILSYCLAGKHTICTFDTQCSTYIVFEHNGDAFPCDFFVEPKWRLGNILETPLEKLAAGEKKLSFARSKKNLCNKCIVCKHLAYCRGGCMKDKSASGDNKWSRESYFCDSYKRFFDYAMPRFYQLAANLRAT